MKRFQCSQRGVICRR